MSAIVQCSYEKIVRHRHGFPVSSILECLYRSTMGTNMWFKIVGDPRRRDGDGATATDATAMLLHASLLTIYKFSRSFLN